MQQSGETAARQLALAPLALRSQGIDSMACSVHAKLALDLRNREPAPWIRFRRHGCATQQRPKLDNKACASCSIMHVIHIICMQFRNGGNQITMLTAIA